MKLVHCDKCGVLWQAPEGPCSCGGMRVVDAAFERGRLAARRAIAATVQVRSELVVRESDGCTLLLVSTHAGQQLLAMQVIEPDEA